MILPLPSKDDLEETDEEAEAGRWAVGSGPDEVGLMPVEEERDFPLAVGEGREGRAGTPRPRLTELPPRPGEGVGWGMYT